MLKKKYRLQSDMISKVFNKGKTFKFDYFYIKFLSDETNTDKKFAIIVSKKVTKKSTQRNRMKRVLRDLFRKNIDTVSCGYYVIVVTKLFYNIDKKDFLEYIF